MTVHLHKGSNKINIRRVVRQGDTIFSRVGRGGYRAPQEIYF